jgi:hypothetical protein
MPGFKIHGSSRDCDYPFHRRHPGPAMGNSANRMSKEDLADLRKTYLRNAELFPDLEMFWRTEAAMIEICLWMASNTGLDQSQ